MDLDERFDTLDYCVFGGMLLVSALIGIYFAYFAKEKQNTTAEYLMGGRSLGVFPMSMSIVASNISGISLLGYPSEIYSYGTQIMIEIPAEAIAYAIAYFFFLPVLYNLQLTSVYEYFEKRFSSSVKKLGSFFFLINTLLYVPVVIYVPALALAHVTDLSLYISIPLVCLVCIFYTTIGGLKAVVWTDTVQTMLIILGVVTVAIIGTINSGGISNIWQRNEIGGRIQFFNMDPDPTLRHTFWTILIGRITQFLYVATVNQSISQRYLAMPTLGDAKTLFVALIFGMAVLITLCCYTGLVIYAAFYDCDPLITKKIQTYDQILPHYILKTTSNIPAFPGIFVAGVFSASLSSISTCLNSWSGVFFEDFIRPSLKKPISEARASCYMKLIVAVVGVITMILAMFVDKLAGVIQSYASLVGIVSGTLVGIFICGTLIPWVNSKGALIGGITSAAFVGWISFGTQFAIMGEKIKFPMKPFSIKGCDNVTSEIDHSLLSNDTVSVINDMQDEIFALYKISYLYYPVIGVLVVIIVAIFVSWITGMNKPSTVNPSLLSPIIHKYTSSYLEEKEMVQVKLMEQT